MFKKHRNVDTIIRDLNNMVDALHDCEMEQIAESVHQTAIINEAETARAVAREEAERAKKIAAKIGELVS